MADSVTPLDRSVVLAGATGLVGSRILEGLLGDTTVSRVHVVGRRALDARHPKLQVHVVDFRQLPALAPVDEVYLALGTTIRVAGSQAAFRAVDLDANLAVAKAAIAAGAKRVALVSSVGADARSSVFYNRVKGELEDALKEALASQLSALVIAQPSLLLGDRDALKQPRRGGERLVLPIARLLAPLVPGRYRPVQASAVAHALVKTLPTAHGTVVLDSAELARIGS